MAVNGHRAKIAEALDWHLNQLVLNPVRRIAQRNRRFTEEANEIYLKPFFLPARSDFAAIGTRFKRYTGIYQVNIVGPENVSPVPQDEVADLVADHFELDGPLDRNSIRVRIGVTGGSAFGSVPNVASEIIAGGWRTVPVSIPWWCDITTS